MTASSSVSDRLHEAASGLSARNAASALSMALSTRCQSAAAFQPCFGLVPRGLEILDARLCAREVAFVGQKLRIDNDRPELREIAKLRKP